MTSLDLETELTLAQRLDLLSNAALQSMLRRLGHSESQKRPDVLRALTLLIGSPAHHEILEQTLSAQQWELLNLLPVQLGPFYPREFLLTLCSQGMTELAAADLVQPLLTLGCLLPARQYWGTNKLSIECHGFASQAMHVWFQPAPHVREWAGAHRSQLEAIPGVPAPASVAGSALAELQRVAFILLTELVKRPARLTTQGRPYKADLTRLAAAVASDAGGGAKRRSSAAAPSPLLWFALAVLLSAGLVQEHDGDIRADEGLRLFTGSAFQQAVILATGWYSSPFDDFARIPALQFGYGASDGVPWLSDGPSFGPSAEQLLVARVAVAKAITMAVSGAPAAWHRIDDLARFVYSQFPEFLFSRLDGYYGYLGSNNPFRPESRRMYPGIYRISDPPTGKLQPVQPAPLYQDTDWMLVEGAFVRQILKEPLRWLGLVEVGPDLGEPECFRLTEIGRQALLGMTPTETQGQAGKTAVIQPTFEVVVFDAIGSLGVLAQLDAFAERRSFDRAATYQLTQAALVRGLDQGWTGPRLLATLESLNGGPLPQNVRFTLEEWIHLYEQLSLREQATVLETDSAEQLDRFLGDPALMPLFGARLGPRVVLVPARHLDEVKQRLSRLAAAPKVIEYGQPQTGILQIVASDRLALQSEGDEPYLRYRLESFTTPLAQRAGSQLYQVTRESVARAASLGWDGQAIVDFLKQRSAGPLPDDLLVNLLGWSGAFPALKAEALVAIRLPSTPVDWEILSKIPALGTRIRAVLGPHLALVAAADLEALRAELADRGIAIADGTIARSQIQAELPATDLRSIIAQHKGDPAAVHKALSAAGLISKIDRIRWGQRI